MRPLLVLQLLALLALANTTPLIVQRLAGSRWAWPLDGGLAFFDGRPLLGRSKTVRGIVLAVLATAIVAPLIGLDIGLGLAIGTAAMAGDVLSSFTKRRLALPPSSKATGLDQIPEALLPLLVCRGALALGALEIAATVAIFFVGEVVLARVFYRLNLRDRPY
jgi:CDP-2,3-bis-(O-geranylgeranyl)-sn-glycerol synthase